MDICYHVGITTCFWILLYCAAHRYSLGRRWRRKQCKCANPIHSGNGNRRGAGGMTLMRSLEFRWAITSQPHMGCWFQLVQVMILFPSSTYCSIHQILIHAMFSSLYCKNTTKGRGTLHVGLLVGWYSDNFCDNLKYILFYIFTIISMFHKFNSTFCFSVIYIFHSYKTLVLFQKQLQLWGAMSDLFKLFNFIFNTNFKITLPIYQWCSGSLPNAFVVYQQNIMAGCPCHGRLNPSPCI